MACMHLAWVASYMTTFFYATLLFALLVVIHLGRVGDPLVELMPFPHQDTVPCVEHQGHVGPQAHGLTWP